MNMEDVTIICIDCDQPFSFTVGEQRFYSKKGFVQPKRCPACRVKRKQEREDYR